MSLVGTWDLESSENFDDFLKHLGVNFILRKAAGSIKPTMIIEQNGNVWTVKVHSSFKNQETTFTEGVEFQEKAMDGRECKGVCTIEGEKMIMNQRNAKTDEHFATVTRQVVDGKLVQTMVSGPITCTRVFKRRA